MKNIFRFIKAFRYTMFIRFLEGFALASGVVFALSMYHLIISWIAS